MSTIDATGSTGRPSTLRNSIRAQLRAEAEMKRPQGREPRIDGGGQRGPGSGGLYDERRRVVAKSALRRKHSQQLQQHQQNTSKQQETKRPLASSASTSSFSIGALIAQMQRMTTRVVRPSSAPVTRAPLHLGATRRSFNPVDGLMDGMGEYRRQLHTPPARQPVSALFVRSGSAHHRTFRTATTSRLPSQTAISRRKQRLSRSVYTQQQLHPLMEPAAAWT
jgi:hypothetical protein